MNSDVLRVLEEVAAADVQILEATVRRTEAWRSLFPNLRLPKMTVAPPKASTRKRSSSKITTSASSTVKSEPEQKRARAFDPVSEKVWKHHYGAVTQWVRNGRYDLPLILRDSPGKSSYAMTSDQMLAIGELRVTHLHLLSCNLSRFAPVATLNTTLRVLYISGNPDFTSFDASFVGLTALESLKVFYCGLCGLPDNIGDMTSLRHIDINRGELHTLPRSIGNLCNLRDIVVTGTRLDYDKVKEALYPCRMLESLRMRPWEKDGEIAYNTMLLARRNARAALDFMVCVNRYNNRIFDEVHEYAKMEKLGKQSECPYLPLRERVIGKHECLFPSEIVCTIAAFIYGKTADEAYDMTKRYKKIETESKMCSSDSPILVDE